MFPDVALRANAGEQRQRLNNHKQTRLAERYSELGGQIVRQGSQVHRGSGCHWLRKVTIVK